MIRLFLILLVATTTPATAQARTTLEKLMTDHKGFITCTGGGTSAPLFTRECNKLNFSRVTSSGSIKYEGTCLDSNNVTFYLSCDAFTFEYSQLGDSSKIPGNR